MKSRERFLKLMERSRLRKRRVQQRERRSVRETQDLLSRTDTGLEVVGITPKTVAVMGDARVYLPAVVLRPDSPQAFAAALKGDIGTKIINEVSGFCRVVVEIPCEPKSVGKR